MDRDCAESAEVLSVATSAIASLASSSLDLDNSNFSGLEEVFEDNSVVPATKRRRLRVGLPEFTASALMLKSCCSRGNVTCFKKLSQKSIESIQTAFYMLSETAQTQQLIQYMREHGRSDGTVLYNIRGEEVCETAFRMVYGLRYNRFSSLKAKYNSGVVLHEHGQFGRGQYTDSSIRAISWLRMFIDKLGDRMPTKDEIHLPPCLTKSDVFGLAAEDLSQGSLECCGMSTFYKIWKKEFPNVKIPQESRFSKCDVCTAIKEGRERTLNPVVRKWLGTILNKHIALERREREKYAKHRNKATKYPSQYLSIIIDGMDQDKTNLPHIISNPKSMAGSFTLETHITGVRVHGCRTFMYIDCGQYPHDSNLTIEVLLRTCQLLEDPLPPVLYVQLDNTCRENKNKFVLTFLAMLVSIGVFRKIKVGFLPVGHTHEDIDQLFSCVSRNLKHQNALTIPDLCRVVKTAFKPEPIMVTLDHVVDAKDWMSTIIPALHDHLKAHQFKFERNHLGQSKMFYKEWSSDKFWLPQGGLSLLPEENAIPSASPRVIMPFFDCDALKKLEASLLKISAYLNKAGVKEWWKTWLEDAKKYTLPNVTEDMKDMWTLFKLSVPHPNLTIRKSPSHNDASTDVSGVEIESPHKELSTAKEFPCNIPQIGQISSSWIGQNGVHDVIEIRTREQSAIELESKSNDLHVLAIECLKAFHSAGLMESDNPDVKKATELCSLHAPPSKENTVISRGRSIQCELVDVWRKDAPVHENHLQSNPVMTAESVLGKDLVDKVVERKNKPPDIYIGRSRSTVHHNQDILRDLVTGTMIATTGVNFPRIGKVTCVPAHPSLQSEVQVQWYRQEKASHKPRWLRYFNPSNVEGPLTIREIVLYDFQLTNKGALKKKTREYLREHFLE